MTEGEAVLQALGLDGGSRVIGRVTGGKDTAIWKVERAGNLYALRLYPPGRLESAARELEAMQVARRGGIPVPEVHAHGEWEGRAALLLSWCPGRVLLSALLRRPWRAYRYGILFGRMQAAIHRIDAPSLHVTHGGLSPARRLLHMDYHILNVMTDGTRITGVLDWANAAAGDPRLDLARTETILRLDMGRFDRPTLLNLSIDPLWSVVRRGWWQGYTDMSPVDGLAPFYAAAGAFMLDDLSGRYSPAQLAPVQRWSDRWRGHMIDERTDRYTDG